MQIIVLQFHNGKHTSRVQRFVVWVPVHLGMIITHMVIHVMWCHGKRYFLRNVGFVIKPQFSTVVHMYYVIVKRWQYSTDLSSRVLQ